MNINLKLQLIQKNKIKYKIFSLPNNKKKKINYFILFLIQTAPIRVHNTTTTTNFQHNKNQEILIK